MSISRMAWLLQAIFHVGGHQSRPPKFDQTHKCTQNISPKNNLVHKPSAKKKSFSKFQPGNSDRLILGRYFFAGLQPQTFSGHFSGSSKRFQGKVRCFGQQIGESRIGPTGVQPGLAFQTKLPTTAHYCFGYDYDYIVRKPPGEPLILLLGRYR